MDSHWLPRINYREDTLIGRVEAESAALGIAISSTDAIDFSEDLYIKKVVVSNLRDRTRGDNYYRADRSVTGNPWVICTLWAGET